MTAVAALPQQAAYRWKGGLIVDNFAGGGGASTGISQAIGRSPDIAVNHDEDALRMHEENHPETRHYHESIWAVDIKQATGGEPVLMGWFSPDCTHFSVAKGGKPVKKSIRGLAWIVKKWCGQSDMAAFFMENVTEFQGWGPLIAKRDKDTGRVVRLVPNGTDRNGRESFLEVVSAPGEQVPYREQALVPDKKRAGRTFRQFIKQLQAMGYEVDFKTKGLVASDYGDPTTRKRFVLVARKDGLPLVWPSPTHGDPKLLPTQAGRLQPWKTAGDNLDWSLPCPSIFDRTRPLAENTLRRIAKGIQKFVIDAGDDAFLVTTNPSQVVAAGMKFRGDSAGFSMDAPVPTITAGGGAVRPAGAPHALGAMQVELKQATAATLIQTGYGERPGQEPRVPGLGKPLGTIVAGGVKHAAVEVELQQVEAGFLATIDHTSVKNTAKPFTEPLSTLTSKARHVRVAALLKHFTGVVGQSLEKPLPTITATDHNSVVEAQLNAVHIQRDFGASVGHSAGEPLAAITAGGGGHCALVASSLVKLKGSCAHGQPLDQPIGTIQAQGNHYAQVCSFLIKYFGTGGAVSVDQPLDTVTSKARFGLVTIRGVDYEIVDIGMRMLEPHELYRCQGFPAGYRHEVVMGKKLPKHAQVRMVGNSVPPGLAKALVQANIPLWALSKDQAPQGRRIANVVF